MGKEIGSQKHFFLAMLFLVGILAVSSYFQSDTTGDYIYPERGLKTPQRQPLSFQTQSFQTQQETRSSGVGGERSCGRMVRMFYSKVCIPNDADCGLYTCDKARCKCTTTPNQLPAGIGEPCANRLSEQSEDNTISLCSPQTRPCKEGLKCDLGKSNAGFHLGGSCTCYRPR